MYIIKLTCIYISINIVYLKYDLAAVNTDFALVCGKKWIICSKLSVRERLKSCKPLTQCVSHMINL